MRLLLDTQIAIWLGLASGRVPARIKELLADPTHDLFVSSVSVWEIVAKNALDKLPLPLPEEEFVRTVLDDFSAEPLAFDLQHALALRSLPLIHRDPFDRMLICQAQVEGLVFVTADETIRQYDVPTLW